MDENDPFNDSDAFIEYQPIQKMKVIKKLCRKLDMYALPITLRYKSEKKFYTNFGALTSLVLMIIMGGFLISYIKEMLADTRVTQ